MKQAPKIDAETIRNGVGNWLLFFVGLEEWIVAAWGRLGVRAKMVLGINGGQEFEKRGSN